MLHCSCVPLGHRLVGLVVKAPASRAANPAFDSCFPRESSSGSSHTSGLKIGTPAATLPDVIGSALGPVGPVSVYRDWVRSANSIPVWQHVQLPEQVRPRDTPACCWDVEQPTHNNTFRQAPDRLHDLKARCPLGVKTTPQSLPGQARCPLGVKTTPQSLPGQARCPL